MTLAGARRRDGQTDAGKAIPNVAPPPGVSVTSTRPPCFSTSSLTIERPRPAPRVASVRRQNGSKTRSRSPAAIPSP
jgi:hypothetical protein